MTQQNEGAPQYDDGTSEDTQATKPERFSLEAFGIRKASNDGARMALVLPDGTETGEFLVVRGADSTAFRNAQAIASRANLKLVKNNKLEPQDLANRQAENQRKLVASLVVGWSFDDEFSEANVCRLFYEAPYIQEAVDVFAGNRRNFFARPPRS